MSDLPIMCAWMPDTNERKCQDQASHFHEACGEVCAEHAARLMAAGQKVARLRRHLAGLKSKETVDKDNLVALEFRRKHLKV